MNREFIETVYNCLGISKRNVEYQKKNFKINVATKKKFLYDIVLINDYKKQNAR